jgi:hypothetical protein
VAAREEERNFDFYQAVFALANGFKKGGMESTEFITKFRAICLKFIRTDAKLEEDARAKLRALHKTALSQELKSRLYCKESTRNQ